MLELFRNRCFVVRCDSAQLLVEVVRTNVPFASAGDATLAFAPMLACLDTLGRNRFGLLFDAREAPAINDPVYEAWYAHHRANLLRDFRRAVILMRTPVGGLHAARLLPPSAQGVRIFQDPQLALEYVTSRDTPSPHRHSSPSLRALSGVSDGSQESDESTGDSGEYPTRTGFSQRTPRIPSAG